MTKGYKATYNYKCLDQLYEIGQEYKMEGKPIVCQKGFHYCIDPKETLYFYPIQPDFKLLEIEDLSEDTIESEDKLCSNHIKIIREITDPDELMKLLGVNFTYDEETKIVRITSFHGYWQERTFNEFRCTLTHKTCFGAYSEYTYDIFGKMTSSKCSTWKDMEN